MRHSLEMAGPAFRLRPVRLYDAAFIAQLRNDPDRAKYLHRGACDEASQQQWLRAYFDRPDDYYFVIENRVTGIREGAAGNYSVDREQCHAEWGRWILRRGSLAALESAWLIYRVGFETLGLEAMYCRTIEENASALAFHDSFGVERVRRLPGHFERDGRRLDAIEGRLTLTRWMGLHEGVAKMAARAAGWAKPSAHRAYAAVR